MNKAKKITIGIIGILLVCFVALFAIKQFYHHDAASDKDMSTEEENIQILTHTFPTTFYVIGDNVNFNSSISVRNITGKQLKDMDLSSTKHAMLVVNDLKNNANMDETQWKEVVSLVKKNSNLNCIYLGTKDLSLLSKVGYYTDNGDIDKNSLSLGMVHEGNEIINSIGSFSTDDKMDDLAAELMNEQVYCLKISNKEN